MRGVLGASWALLGRSWGALGRSWGALGRSWGALEASWDALGTLLGRSWGAPGGPRSVLGDLGSILDPPRVDFRPSGRRFLGLRKLLCEALGVDFASALRLTCERLASDSQVRRAHCIGRHSSESTQVDPSRRQTDRHTLRSKSSTSLPESQADRQAHVAKQKLDDLTARLSGRSCKRSGQRNLHTSILV